MKSKILIALIIFLGLMVYGYHDLAQWLSHASTGQRVFFGALVLVVASMAYCFIDSEEEPKC